MTIELKLTFHVLLHSKYSMVNIIACFAGPTTWGQSRGLGTEQRPGDRAETWGQSRGLGTQQRPGDRAETWGQSRGLGTQQRPGPRSQDYLKNFIIKGGERSSSWRLPELRGVRRV